jgi:NADH-ubiquinone oxidoreductase chain 2
MFYLLQYSLSNLNIFCLLLASGYFLYNYLYKGKENYKDLQEKNYSPIQYIDQLKGYLYINPSIALSLSVTLFSFIGVPPLLGFFGKQMILSSAVDKGFFFISFIAIITSVIAAVYYLIVVKEQFFYKKEYKKIVINKVIEGYIKKVYGNIVENTSKSSYTNNTITLSCNTATTISILTGILSFFILVPSTLVNLTTISSSYYC